MFKTRMRALRTAGIAALAGAAIVLSACAGGDAVEPTLTDGEPVIGGVINVALSGEPTTLDAMATRSVLTQIFSTHITETLFALDAEFEPQPMLVSDYEVSDDGTEYRMSLREGVVFHNAEPLTTRDVIASLERFKDMSGIGAAALAGSELTAADDHTFTITFDGPQGNLLSALSDRQAPIYPASVLENAGPGPLDPDDVIGTGPYAFEEWAPGVDITLARYDDYSPVDAESSGVAGEKIAYADAIRFVAVPNAASRIAALESGQYQIGEGFGGDDVQLVESAPNIEAVRMRLGKLMMIVNTTLPPLDDPEVRRAVLVGLDIEAFGQILGGDENWNVAPSMLPSDIPLSSDAGAEYFNRGDVEEAKRLLAEAGYDGTPVTIMTPTLTSPQSQSVIMQEQLEAMGIPTVIEAVELPVMQTRRGDPNDGWNLVSSQVSGQTDITQTTYLACGNAYSYICVDEIDQALADFSSAVGTEARQEAHDHIQELFYREVPAYLTAEFWDLYAVPDSLHGFANVVQPFFWNAWVAD